MPLPIFPVDSAINCSSHAPRSEIPGEVTIVILSRPLFAATPRIFPRMTPGFESAAEAAPHALTISSMFLRNFATSSPMTAAGTMPKLEIENMQLGKALDFSKRHTQNFGAEAGAAHAQQKSMLEPRLLHFLGDLLESINVRKLLFGDGEPAEPITFVCATP